MYGKRINRYKTMKKTAFLRKSFLLIAMMGWAMTGNAQKYEVDNGRVYFGNELLEHVDVQSFVDLGLGYAKDRFSVFMKGKVLENVDPSTFRLKKKSARQNVGADKEEQAVLRGYFKTQMNVYYGDKKVDAMASSFEELGGGYAKDAFNVFYCGEKVEGAMVSSFKYTGDGYAEDSFDAYYRGRKLK